MKIFLDTNVILEYFSMREEYEITQRLFNLLHKRHDELLMSVGGFYTMIFVIDKMLKKDTNLTGESRIQALRDIMERILSTISVAEHDSESLLRGIKDTRFKDIEDACQYELAQKAGCDYLITFNASDFILPDNALVRVASPQDFLQL